MALSLTIHVGQPKAGSTSIQRMLAAHAARLSAAGIDYPLHPGRRDHVGEAADFVLTHSRLPADGDSHALQLLRPRAAAAGRWSDLVQTVHRGRHVLLSLEDFSLLSPRLAHVALAELTDGHPERATVVLVLRPASALLPSLYTQMALSDPMPRFETWVRLQLRTLLLDDTADGGARFLDSWWLRRSWASAGEIRCVPFRPEAGADFEIDVLRALSVDQVITPPALGHENAGPSASWVFAWQQHRNARGWSTNRTALIREIRRLAGAGIPGDGARTRFVVTSEVAEVVDRAFPTTASPGDDSRVARGEVARLIVGAEPLTGVGGASDDEVIRQVAIRRASLESVRA